jgi:hypothetical protein
VDVPLSTSAVVATHDDLFRRDERLALVGFLVGYSGLIRDAYTLDVRQYVTWCTEHRVAVPRRSAHGRPRRTSGLAPGVVVSIQRSAQPPCIVSNVALRHDENPSTSVMASTNRSGASWGRLCPMPPEMVRCLYLPENFVA